MTEEKLLDKLLENVIDEATSKVAKKEVNLQNKPQMKFSKEHERKMKEIFKKAREEEILKNVKINIKRVAIILVIFLVAFTICASTVDAWRDDLVKFWLDIKEKYSTVNTWEDDNEFMIGKIKFYYVPEGFECEHSSNIGNVVQIGFKNKERKYINIQVQEVNKSNKINTEDYIVLEEIKLEDKDAIYTENKKGERLIAWQEGKMLYTVHANISKEEIIKFVENIKKVD